MMAWDIKEGDAVFVPDFTFLLQVKSYLLEGDPVFVDVDRDTFNLDSIKLEKAIQRVIKDGKLTPKAIIPVDLFGLPANYVEIVQDRSKIWFVSFRGWGARFCGSIMGKRACSFGRCGDNIIFPSKAPRLLWRWWSDIY